jgi:hypothetical protein
MHDVSVVPNSKSIHAWMELAVRSGGMLPTARQPTYLLLRQGWRRNHHASWMATDVMLYHARFKHPHE